MLPSSHYSRRTRRDRLSISVIPEQSIDAEPRSPYLHWLFGENSEIDINSRLVEDEPEAVEDGTGYSKTDAMVMREVAAWLELREHDEFWVSKRKHGGKAGLPTHSACCTWVDKMSRSFLRPANFSRDFEIRTAYHPSHRTVTIDSML